MILAALVAVRLGAIAQRLSIVRACYEGGHAIPNALQPARESDRSLTAY
ncbi:MAG: hypothetical protein AAGA40_16105 [Cyanobacteria bacterium P01_E01_bin.45]